MKRLLFILACMCSQASFAQSPPVSITVVNEAQAPVFAATVELYSPDHQLQKIQMTDSAGHTVFAQLSAGSYYLRISHSSYNSMTTAVIKQGESVPALILSNRAATLESVTVTTRRPFIELQAGKTVVNLDASPTNVGTTAMEALEKMPGITIDKDGNIAIKGRAGVTVLIDGRQTYLDPAQLATMLSSMNASQIAQVEIMDQPSSRFDAAGNAGMINIRLKKNLQRGFNVSVTTAYTQGLYPKNNNSIQLNYRSGKWNLFSSYSSNFNNNFYRIYALRRYFHTNGSIDAIMEQFTFNKFSGETHQIRTGADYALTPRTTLGLNLSSMLLDRQVKNNNPALWMNAQRTIDSSIVTSGYTKANWKNGGANLNLKHVFAPDRELTADVDVLGYRIRGNQFFENRLQSPNGYNEGIRASIPSEINIISAKADYVHQHQDLKWESGLKTSFIETDNLAAYERSHGGVWVPDYGRSNQFLYHERISAAYTSAEMKKKQWTVQAGLRYESTNYDARQLGNAVQKDSSFSRSYHSVFPSFFTTYAADSNHSFSFTAGRRIDRPAFQKLNPFIVIINKYTYMQGNPYYRPQFTWNTQLSHMYKNVLITSIGYSITRDYFSQIFPIDSSGLVIYTEGNLDKLQHFTLSVGTQLAPAKWWNLSSQAVLVHKKMQGVIGTAMEATITQLNFNMNNQFRFGKGWTGELSGFFTSRSQNDIQEIVDPAGQLSAGVAKAVLNNKGTIRCAVRDIFYTQWMKGNTFFPRADEYFKLTRDTRVATLSLTYRFGKAFKTNKRSEGAAGEEIQRVGNG